MHSLYICIYTYIYMAFSTFNSLNSSFRKNIVPSSPVPDILWYKFESTDISSNNLNLKNYAGTGDYNALCSVSGMLSNAQSVFGAGSLYMNGTSYVNLNSSIVNTFNGTQSATYSIWVFQTSGGSGYTPPFILRYNGMYNLTGIGLTSTGVMTRMDLSQYIPLSVTIALNTWHNIALTLQYTATNSWVAKLYVDGVSQPFNYAPNVSGSGTSTIGNPNTNNFSTQGVGSFYGHVDDFRVYSYALTDAQMTLIYNKK
jgi:hypothetical protein